MCHVFSILFIKINSSLIVSANPYEKFHRTNVTPVMPGDRYGCAWWEPLCDELLEWKWFWVCVEELSCMGMMLRMMVGLRFVN
jgi:hypothetical protein